MCGTEIRGLHRLNRLWGGAGPRNKII